MEANGYNNSVRKDDGYHIANVISAADSNGTSTHTSGDVPTPSSSAPLLVTRQREEAGRQMEITKSAMHNGPMDSGHPDPDRAATDTFGVGIDGSAARLPSLAPTDPSSADLSSTNPSSTPLNPGMKRRMRSRSPQAPAAKRQKEAAENAIFDDPVPNCNDSSSNRTTNDTPGANDSAVACPSSHTSTPSSSAPLTRKQRRKLRSKIRRAAKRYKEKQMRLAQEAISGSSLTECNYSDPNPTRNDAPGVDNNSAPACLSGDVSIPLAGLHGTGMSNEE